jgi:hypothetical protein
MKAPDKIYTDNRGIYAEIPVFSQADANVEYLRKDALLEWANRLKERWEEPPMSSHSPGCVFMLEQVIKKIESL